MWQRRATWSMDQGQHSELRANLNMRAILVVGKYHKIIESSVNQYLDKKITNQIEYIDQPKALGTGHAIKCCQPKFRRI